MSASSRPPRTAGRRLRRFTLWRSGLGVISALACIGFARTAAAQTYYYWDGNGATTGAGTSAQVTGTWGTSPFWSTDPAGTSATSTTGPGSGDYAVFTAFDNVAANNPTGNYTVTLGSAQSVLGLIIGPATYNATYANNDGALTLAAGTFGLTIGAGGVVLNGSSGDPTFTGAVVLGADQTWTINNAHVIKIAGTVSGNATAGNTRTYTLGNVGAYNPEFLTGAVISDGTAGGNVAVTLNNTASTVTTPTGGIGGYTGGTWLMTTKVNTYTGATAIARGNLQITSIANLGVASSLGAPTTAANGAISMGSGTYYATLTLDNSSAAMTTNRGINLTGTTGGAEIYNNNGTAGNTVTFTGDLTNTGAGAKTFGLRGANTGNNVFGGALVDSAAGGALTVSKYDAGQWTLSSTNSTFTGGLTVAGGTLNLTAASAFSGGITLTGGTLAVGTTGTLGSNVVGNSISIQGGNLLLSADANVGTNQAINITSAGGGIGVSATPGSAFPSITAATGAPIVFGLNYTGTGGIGMTGGSGATDVPGIDALFTPTSATFLGSFAAGSGTGTYTGTTLPVGAGNTYRVGGGGGTIMFQNSVFTGANNLLAGTTGGGTVILPNANTYTGTTTVQIGTLTATSLNSVVGGTSSSSLGAPTTAANGTITIGLGTNIAGLNYTGGATTSDRIVNIAGSGGTSILSNGGTGALVLSTAPTFTETAAKTFQLGAATDAFGGMIGAITDSTSVTAKTSLVKLGLTNSTWTIGTSTYTGGTTINGGVLSSPTVLPNSALITLAGSGTANLGILQTNGTFARTISTTTGLNWQTNGGFAAFGGKLTVTLNANAAIAYGTAGFFPNNGTMSFGSTTANSQVEFTNPVNLAANDGFQRAIYVEKGVGGDSALLSGALSQPGGTGANPGIIKQGKGTLILSGANTFSGTVTVSAGSLVAGNNSTGTATGAFGTGTGPTANPTAPSPIVVGDGNTGVGGNPAVLIGGAYTVDRPLTFSDNGTNNAYTVGGTTDANATFSGAITVLTGGTAANNNTFTITQAATTGNNALNITGGITGGTNAVRTINFNNAGTVNVSSTGIINGAGTLGVTKTNTGMLNLSAFNIYSGPTLVNGGTLLVDGSTIAASVFTVGNGTTLTGTLGGAGTINGAVTLNAGSRITGGTLGGVNKLSLGSTLTLNSGSVYQLDIGAGATSDVLAITGALLSNGATINVNSGTLNGTSTYTIATYGSDTGSTFTLTNAPGYQVFDTGTALQLIPMAAVPEPSTWAIIALFAGLGATAAARRRRNA